MKVYRKIKAICQKFRQSIYEGNLQVFPLNGGRFFLPVRPHFEEEGSSKHFTINLHFDVVLCKNVYIYTCVCVCFPL